MENEKNEKNKKGFGWNKNLKQVDIYLKNEKKNQNLKKNKVRGLKEVQSLKRNKI